MTVTTAGRSRGAARRTAPAAVKAPAKTETLQERRARLEREWAELGEEMRAEQLAHAAGGRRIVPPVGTQSFTFVAGCGQPHECDGEPIACDPCAAYLASLPEHERINDARLRPTFDSIEVLPAGGAALRDPEAAAASDARRRAYDQHREAASWRLVS